MSATLRAILGILSRRRQERLTGRRTAAPDHPTNNFDFLRLTGAVFVLYGHAYPLTGATGPGFAGNAIGTIGVKIFFVISGYLVALSWLRDPDIIRFFIRRALRIFPALIGVVIFTVVLLGPAMTSLPLDAYARSPLTTFYLRNIVLYINYALPGVFEHNVYPIAVNGSLWSLPAEFSMYLLIPLLLSRTLIGGRLALAVIAIGLAAAAVVFVRAFPQTTPIVIYATNFWSWLEVAPFFVLGSAFAYYRLDRAANIYVAFVGLLALAVFDTGVTIKEALLLAVLPYAAVSFGLGRSNVLSRITGGHDLSYGVFLFGFPVQQTLTALLGPQIGPWGNFGLALVICSALAYLSWIFIERPALALKPMVARRRRGRSDDLYVEATDAERTPS